MSPTNVLRWSAWRRIVILGMVMTLAAALALVAGPPGRAAAASTLLSQGQPATASSTESAAYPASDAVDGNTGTRWSSAFSDPQWLQVDLGATASITSVTLQWEAAYATAFQIQTSSDGTNWTTIYSTTTGTGGTQTLNVTGTGRYVRMYGTARATQYGVLALGIPGLRSLAAAAPAAPRTPPSTSPPPPPRPRTPACPRRTRSTATPAPAGPARSPTRSGCRWTSGPARRSAGSRWTGRPPTGRRSRSRRRPTAPTGPRSTPRPPAPAASQALNVTGTGRYVRMYGTVRATQYGYSLWEFEVYTTSGGGGEHRHRHQPRQPDVHRRHGGQPAGHTRPTPRRARR